MIGLDRCVLRSWVTKRAHAGMEAYERTFPPMTLLTTHTADHVTTLTLNLSLIHI